ncbi:MAG: flippase-like domain-containing protein [Paludibacteraceae bacterium]|nr:flippase-like domain-containing protein [Paludibacteraceae bacterium]
MKPSNWFDKPWWKVVKWFIVLLAYGYLAYKLATYDDYATLWSTLHSKLALRAYTLNLIIIALALMPLNIFLEAVKWRFLNRDIETMSLREAQRQVYIGFIGAFLTPYRVGDFPSRAMCLRDKSRWGEATVMGFVGGVALTLVIVVIGLLPAVFYFNQTPAWWQVLLAIVGCLAVGLLAPYLLHIHSLNSKLSTEGRNETATLHSKLYTLNFIAATGWSLLRYLVFGLQLYLVLRWVGVPLGITEAVTAIPFYYLLVTLTPNMPIADVGIRGSWAVVVFGRYADVPLVTAAVVVVYVINTLLPMVVGSILMLCRKS